MQECLNFHVRFIDLGLFFHVLISPVNIWGERLWTEISLNRNKSVRVNVIWTSAFHLLKCQNMREGVITEEGSRGSFFPSKTPPGLCFEGHNIHMQSNGTKLFFLKFLNVISLHTAPQGIKFEFRTAVWFFGSYFILKKLPFLKQRLRERERFCLARQVLKILI